jgi:addiction module HigA family antidote
MTILGLNNPSGCFPIRLHTLGLGINIHPGEILREEYLEPLQLTAYRLAKDIGVPQTRISEILKERRSITADTALRFGKYFGTTPEFWLNMQGYYDLRQAALDAGEAIASIPRFRKVLVVEAT